MRKRKPLTEIPESFAAQALQILSNFCNQSTKDCAHCYLRDGSDNCVIYNDFPERVKEWKRSKNIEIVNK